MVREMGVLPRSGTAAEPWARLPLAAFASHLFDRVDAAVLVVDLEGVISYASPYCEVLYGRVPSEMIGRQSADFALEPPSPALRSEIASALRAGSSWEGAFAVRRRDGSILELHAVNAPVFDDAGSLAGVVTLAIDPNDPHRTPNNARAKVFAVMQILNDVGETLV
jgi:PAS domain S-box-containing protein